MSRQRPAPIASRIAISFWRAVARASKRLATLAQAISSTSPTTAMRRRSGRENSLRRSERPLLPGTTSIRANSRAVLPRSLCCN